MSGKIERLAARRAKEDNREWTVRDALQDAIDDIDCGNISPTKAVVLHVDTSDGEYKVGFTCANLSCWEAIGLLEVGKLKFHPAWEE